MVKHSILAAGLFVSMAIAPAWAQTQRVEISGFGGWTFSDGVSGDNIVAGDGNIYNRADPKDSGTFGFSVGVNITDHSEVGFLYGHQYSALVLGGTNDRNLGSMGIGTYHAYFAYNFGEADAPFRPFVFGGLGASNYNSVDTVFNGVTRTIPGRTQFSSTWGGGVKFYSSPHVGVRLAARWTPAYVKTDEAGWWCDPYWGCYLVGNAQYANQFDLTGGITVRF